MIGERLLALLDSSEVKQNEYLAILLLSLFARIPSLNHFARLSERFPGSSASLRREILLAAKANNADGWIRQHKQSFLGMDDWQKYAFLYCCSGLPPDERKYFISRQTFSRPFDKVLAKWSKS